MHVARCGVGSRGGQWTGRMHGYIYEWMVDVCRPENSAARPRAPTLFSVDLADAEARAWEWNAPSPFAGQYLTRQPGWMEHASVSPLLISHGLKPIKR